VTVTIQPPRTPDALRRKIRSGVFVTAINLVEGAQPMTRFPFWRAAAVLFAPPLQRARRSARSSVGRANDAARVQPDRATFLNAIQQYAWAEGALFQVYTAPGQVTDIALQEGEELVGPGPVAAGDTVRWIIGDTLSGEGAARGASISW
jgi:type IV secretory pathway VirB9-like protein